MGVHNSLTTGQILIVNFSLRERENFSSDINVVCTKLLCSYDVINCLEEAREYIKSKEISTLILQDWKADEHGLRFLRDARKALSRIPIIVVADTLAERDWDIAAYEFGADNYFVPSCNNSVIAARLKGLLARQDNPEHALSISDMKVWTQSGVVFRAGNPIKLSTKEMELLLYLAANKSRPVSRMEILKEVFGLSFEPGTNVVEVHIHRLRQKIDNRSEKPLLNTVRGEGYVLG